MAKVLLVEDDRIVHELVIHSLRAIDVDVVQTFRADEALEMLGTVQPDVVILDILLPDYSGIELFKKIHGQYRRIPVIFMTGLSDTQTAIQAMQLGAYDYLTKPISPGRLQSLVQQAIDSHRIMKSPVALATHNREQHEGDLFLGCSEPMLEVLKSIGRVAAQLLPVLILGESGTGKELAARAVYQNSTRSKEVFCAVNCAALPDSLLESELFGHEKGAFSGADRQRIGRFEASYGGTIFLDEIGDMSLLVQAKLLRLLQQQEFQRLGSNQTIRTDVRIIAATNRDLPAMVASGEFREDLYYRLNGVVISLPPLRERAGDLDLLIQYFMSQMAHQLNRNDLAGISTEALAMLRNYHWPGNIRQLQSVVRQAILSSPGPVIVPAGLPSELATDLPKASLTQDTVFGEDSGDLCTFIAERLDAGSKALYAETVELMERFLLTKVLESTRGNQSLAAEILGITRGKVRQRVRQFGLLAPR
jgi:two-component system nitrogen regulation response regulator GlnG